ncbi:hypothetical protein MMC18_004325 [Xylographa bjoerkii]|nr:hypothetical protein [Xylographa bjoerkii]
MTDFYKLYIIATKHVPTYEMALHQKYGTLINQTRVVGTDVDAARINSTGSIVRVAPNLLAISNPDMIPAVYNKSADKGDFYSHGVMGESPPIFQTLKQEEHTPKRRIITRSLSTRNIPTLEDNVNERIAEMRDVITAKFASTGDRFDFSEWVRWMLFDTITQVTFSNLIGFIKHGQDVNGFISSIYGMSYFAGLIATLPWLMRPLLQHPYLKRFLLPHEGDGSGTARVMMYQDRIVENHLRYPDVSPQRDILHNLLQIHTPDGSALPIEDVKAESMVFVFTASVTLSAIVCPFVNYILSNHEVSKNLLSEIVDFDSRQQLSSPIASFCETSKMPYFMACIQETLRLSPPTPVLLTRKVGKEGLWLNDTLVPEATEIGANPYVINRNVRDFGADAHVFRPERWLEDPEASKHMAKRLLTWGYGVRDCAGKAISRLILQKLCLQIFTLTIHTYGQLFRDFDITLDGDHQKWAKHEDRGLCFYQDQWINIKARTPL